MKTYYEGTAAHPFYSGVMGKHQWLPNGNLLITESCNGRAFEIDRNGKIVLEYNNFTKQGYVDSADGSNAAAAFCIRAAVQQLAIVRKSVAFLQTPRKKQ